MTYRELQGKLKEYKLQGLTDIKLNVSKEELQKEYNRVTTLIEKDLKHTTDEVVEYIKKRTKESNFVSRQELNRQFPLINGGELLQLELKFVIEQLPGNCYRYTPKPNTVEYDEKEFYTDVTVVTEKKEVVVFRVNKNIAETEEDILTHILEKEEKEKVEYQELIGQSFSVQQEQFFKKNLEKTKRVLKTVKHHLSVYKEKQSTLVKTAVTQLKEVYKPQQEKTPILTDTFEEFLDCFLEDTDTDQATECLMETRLELEKLNKEYSLVPF